jgi:hypothetical protein
MLAGDRCRQLSTYVASVLTGCHGSISYLGSIAEAVASAFVRQHASRAGGRGTPGLKCPGATTCRGTCADMMSLLNVIEFQRFFSPTGQTGNVTCGRLREESVAVSPRTQQLGP